MIVMGIDPGTGVSSPTGVVAFDAETRLILLSEIINGKKIEKERRARWIASGLAELIDTLSADPITKIGLVSIETFVMRGKGGQTLQNLIGALESRIPDDARIQRVFNTTVKRIVAGSGDAEKLEVALGVLAWFNDIAISANEVRSMIKFEKWDLTDALAIGIAGYKQEMEERNNA